MHYLLGRKQKEIDASNSTKWKNGAHYYGLWSILMDHTNVKLWSVNKFEDLNWFQNSFFT